MCGIAGLLYPRELQNPGPDKINLQLRSMANAMEHRGPDGEGFWQSPDTRIGLAHRRLAIIDLSPDAAQPMTSGDDRIWATFNGEIYNHMILRHELENMGHRFQTDHSDTEVLIHGYRAWGIEGLANRLEGMFALAIWDMDRQVMSLLRDRIGIKPIYFTRAGGVFRFASEIKSLFADPTVQRRMEPNALGHYLSFMVTPAPLTLFEGIFKLPAAHIMEVDAHGKISARRYWDALPGKGADHGASDDVLAAGVLERLEAAIEKRMMSDVPLGVFLSGGIDSSANVALMDRVSSSPIETFTVGFNDHTQLNELDYARKIAEQFKTNHHEVLVNSSDMQGYLRDLIHQQDEPIADWVCVPLYFVSKLAKESGVTVVHVGEGSDEQFCGYDSWMSYLNAHASFWQTYNKVTPAPLRRAIAAMASRVAPTRRAKGAQIAEALLRAGTGRELFWSGANAFWNVHKSRIFAAARDAGPWSELSAMGFEVAGLEDADSGAVVDGYFSTLDRDHPKHDFLTRMSYAEFRQRLPELLLMRVDKITMSTSVEGRVPFLDHALVDYTMDIPQEAKVRGGVKKAVLKTALKGIIPDDIIHRPKMGFAAPVENWLRDDFGREVEHDLLASPLVKDGLLKAQPVAELLAEHRAGHTNHALHIWTLFNLTAWHDHWIH